MMFMRLVFVLILVGSCLSKKGSQRPIEATAKPSTCRYEELKGNWIFDVGEGGYDKATIINCLLNGSGEVARSYRIHLDYPNVVRDEFGNVGFWTMIEAAQGFEVVVHGRKFVAYIKISECVDDQETRFCNETALGTSHDLLGRDWSCFFGRKVSSSSSVPRVIEEGPLQRDIRSTNNHLTREELQRRLHKTELDIIVDSINAAQSSWTAANYEEYDTMTVDELLSRAGYRLKRKNRAVIPKPITQKQQKLAAGLPDSFDWRNVSGINYVTPVRDQGTCGSCYAFASTAMNEARLAIFTKRTVQVIFSPQDIVNCALYAFGCKGGSPYLIGGKYAEDYGMVEESCSSYKGVESENCDTEDNCTRYYFTGYEFLGGYYGACNEAEMMLALVNYGPLVVSLKVNEDLIFFKSGIYSPTGISSFFNPFVELDHAVLLVGYGVDETHGKYWIMKNSWGANWGEDNGFFRLPRGINVCGIESHAMQSFPMF